MNSSLQLAGLSVQGFHRLHATLWTPEAAVALAPPVVCVHGLTRNGRDFDFLAEELSRQGRVVAAPDVVGRGGSDWLRDPAGYTYPQYLADAAVLLARLGAPQVDWVGTSMGGLMGLMLAAQPGSPIRRLVLNDVGPFIPKAALEHIAGYVGKDPHFPTEEALLAYLMELQAAFGLSEADWRRLLPYNARRHADGSYGLAYDPGIAAAFAAGAVQDVDLWALWEAVQCPVLVLRGRNSGLLTPETAHRMAGKATVVEIPDTGHAPGLNTPAQIAEIARFLG